MGFDECLSQDILGYIIELCPVTVAVRLRCCSKSLSTSFVWNHIRHFDNRDYAEDESCRVANALVANSAHLKRFQSLIISQKVEKGNEAPFNELILRTAPQLVRLVRIVKTLSIQNEPELLERLNPRILKELHLPAIKSSNINAFFQSHKSFDALKKLVVTQDYNHFHDPFAEKKVTEFDSVRPLLQTLAARVTNLESLSICITDLEDDDGPIFDEIKRLVEANSQSLNILDFCVNGDNFGPFQIVLRAPNTLSRLDELFKGAITDPFKWNTLPEAFRAKFGIDIVKFRILGYPLWPLVVHQYIEYHKKYPPLQATQELYAAMYPKDQTSCSARMKAFEVFLRPPSSSVLKQIDEGNHSLVREYEAWMTSEARANLDLIGPRSERWTPIITGLLSIIYCQKHAKLSFDALWDRTRELALMANPSAPLVAIFEALYAFNDFLNIEMADFIVEHSNGMKIDLFARIGPERWPLGPLLRQFAPDTFVKLVKNPDLFDPLARDPSSGNIPCVVFHIFHPMYSILFMPAHSIRQSATFIELIKVFGTVESQLGEFRYEPTAHVVSVLYSRMYHTHLEFIVTKILHPLDFTNYSIVEAFVTAFLDFDASLPVIIAKIQRHKDGTKLLDRFSELCWHFLRTDALDDEDKEFATAISRFLEVPLDIKTKYGIM